MYNSFQERQPNTDNIISAKLKLNEFFLTYLSQNETTQYIHDLLNGLNQTSSNNNNNNVKSTPSSPSTSPYKQPISANLNNSNNSNSNANPPIFFSLGESTSDNLENIDKTPTEVTVSVTDLKTDNIEDTSSSTTNATTKEVVDERETLRESSSSSVSEVANTTTTQPSLSPQKQEQEAEKEEEQDQKQEKQADNNNLSIDNNLVNNNNNNISSPTQTIALTKDILKNSNEDACVVDSIPTAPTTITTLPITSENNISIKIPQFYFPKNTFYNEKLENSIFLIKNRFQTFKSIDMNQPLNNTTTTDTCNITQQPAKYISSFDEFEIIIRELQSFPRILNKLLFLYIIRILKITDTIYIPQETFIEFWKTHIFGKDAEDLLFNILKKSDDSKFLFYEDFFLFSKTLIDFHPGLEFLANTPEFQDRYQETIIIRIFYGTCRNKGRITAKDLRSNNFIRSLSLLDAEPDINKHLEYFSYEHFYVIYCKFWELDMDHDLFIDSNDLGKYGNCSLTPLIIDRIITNSIFTKSLFGIKNKISYQDFVWFILSEEDKTSETSIEFWFNCVDLDCDGFLSLYEMDTFYKEQKQRLDYLNLDPPVFKDLLCQMLDMIKPEAIEKITLLDLKSSKMSGYLFNVLFNINKFLQQESKESITCDQPMSDWNRFALQEYERALAEESLSYQDDDDDDQDNDGDQHDDDQHDDDDDDQDDDDDNNNNYHQDNRMLIG